MHLIEPELSPPALAASLAVKFPSVLFEATANAAEHSIYPVIRVQECSYMVSTPS